MDGDKGIILALIVVIMVLTAWFGGIGYESRVIQVTHMSDYCVECHKEWK